MIFEGISPTQWEVGVKILKHLCVSVTKVQAHLLSTFSIELIAIVLTVNRCVRCLVDCGLQQKQHNLVTMAHSSSSNNIQNILKDEKIVQVDEDHVHTQETKQNIKSSSKLETGKQSSSVKEKKAFQLLPLEILDLLLSFLKPEDILMLRNCLPRVQHCPRFKRLVNKTSWFNRMWDEISYHEQIHENCIHICLPEVTINPFNDYDLEKEVEDSESCYFLGKGIFCFPWNELRGENNVQYEKQIVPLKKHIHCNCEENEPNLCAVHEDDEKYEESISFAKRMWKYGGYDDVQSTNTD